MADSAIAGSRLPFKGRSGIAVGDRRGTVGLLNPSLITPFKNSAQNFSQKFLERTPIDPIHSPSTAHPHPIDPIHSPSTAHPHPIDPIHSPSTAHLQPIHSRSTPSTPHPHPSTPHLRTYYPRLIPRNTAQSSIMTQ